MRLIISLLFFYATPFAFAEDICLQWFQSSGVKAGSKGCILACDTIIKDMSTFDCANRCEEFCKLQKCAHDSFWKNKIKNGVPKDWGVPVEQTSKWDEKEVNQILNILDLMPDRLKQLPIEGIYRMKKSVTITNPSSTSADGKSIVIYDRSFNNPFWSFSSILTHELGHVLLQSLSLSEKKSFNDQMGWTKSGETYSRKGEFITTRAKDDPDEDFAESFSFFILSRETLKSKSPKAYAWFNIKYSNSLNTKKGCRNEK